MIDEKVKNWYFSDVSFILNSTFFSLKLSSQSDTIPRQSYGDSIRKTVYYEYYISYASFYTSHIKFDFINFGRVAVDNNNRFLTPLDQLELSIGINKGNNLIIQSNLIGLRNNTGKIFGLHTYNDISCGLIVLYKTDAKNLNLGIKAEGKLAIGYKNVYFLIGVGYIQSEIGRFVPISLGLSYRFQ